MNTLSDGMETAFSDSSGDEHDDSDTSQSVGGTSPASEGGGDEIAAGDLIDGNEGGLPPGSHRSGDEIDDGALVDGNVGGSPPGSKRTVDELDDGEIIEGNKNKNVKTSLHSDGDMATE